MIQGIVGGKEERQKVHKQVVYLEQQINNFQKFIAENYKNEQQLQIQFDLIKAGYLQLPFLLKPLFDTLRKFQL